MILNEDTSTAREVDTFLNQLASPFGAILMDV
jgi:hypothetical protein